MLREGARVQRLQSEHEYDAQDVASGVKEVNVHPNCQCKLEKRFTAEDLEPPVFVRFDDNQA